MGKGSRKGIIMSCCGQRRVVPCQPEGKKKKKKRKKKERRPQQAVIVLYIVDPSKLRG